MPDNRVLYGKQDFNPPVKVSRHQIGTAKKYLVISPVMEIVDPGMLKEPPDNRTDRDILADTGDTGTKTADPAYLQFHLYSGL
jgi:hypothetical protein